MQVVLKEEYKITDQKGDVRVHLSAGFAFTALNPSYIPRDSDILLQGWEKDHRDIFELFYVFYVRSVFIGVPKKSCEVPITKDNGWRYNI